MAFLGNPDLMFSGNVLNDCIDININDPFYGVSSKFLLDTADSDSDLPDNEHPVDLIEYLDRSDIDSDHNLHRNKCLCHMCARKYCRRYNHVSSRQDPFMGMWCQNYYEESPVVGISDSTLGQPTCSVDYDSGSEEFMQQKVHDTNTFSAWNTPKSSDYETNFLASKSISWHVAYDDESSDLNFPDTPSPSAPSAANTGDDSDVDIETITETPRSADSCGYTTQDSSRSMSPSSSPEPIWKFENIGHSTNKPKSATALMRSGKYISISQKSSSNTSSDEHLTNRTSLLGQKRKLSKDRKLTCKTPSQPAYSHVLCNSNSVNFHDYAMSPGACIDTASTETGKPTVLSKRFYKRHISVDSSGKEKQHHHNQLERNRRQKLADLFVDLREEVPKIVSHAKASKVLILKEATVYIHDLQKLDKRQEDDISKELRKKQLLKNQLRNLQAQISSHCVK